MVERPASVAFRSVSTPESSSDLRVARPNRHSFGRSSRVLGGEHCLLAPIGSTTPKASSSVWRHSTYSFQIGQIGAATSHICRSHRKAGLRSRSITNWNRRLAPSQVASTGDSAKHHGRQSAMSIAPIAGQPWPVRSARAGVVTPLRDGMNLVAKEYVAAQDAHDPGVLILSRFAGAAAECRDALLVNPYDSESVATAIARALEMPLSERQERHSHILETLSQNTSDVWGARFLQSLEQLEVPGSDDESFQRYVI